MGVFRSFSIMDFEFLDTLKPFAKTLYINDKRNLSDRLKLSK